MVGYCCLQVCASVTSSAVALRSGVITKPRSELHKRRSILKLPTIRSASLSAAQTSHQVSTLPANSDLFSPVLLPCTSCPNLQCLPRTSCSLRVTHSSSPWSTNRKIVSRKKNPKLFVRGNLLRCIVMHSLRIASHLQVVKLQTFQSSARRTKRLTRQSSTVEGPGPSSLSTMQSA